MHLTLRQLSVLEAVARLGSFTRAARELHLSQPAVSMQVRQVEEAVGLPLFDKSGKAVRATEAGRALNQCAIDIAARLRELEQSLEALHGLQRGHLRISVASTANHFATRLLAAFVERHPGISFSLSVTNRRALLDQLDNGQADIALMGQPPADAPLTAQAFMRNPLVVIAAPDHPLAQRGATIALPDLARETFVLRESESGTRAALERFFQEHALELRAGMTMNANEAIKQTVAAGLGLGVVSIHTLELELRTGELVVLDVEAMPIERQWFLVRRQGARQTPVVEAFEQFIASEAAQALMAVPAPPGAPSMAPPTPS